MTPTARRVTLQEMEEDARRSLWFIGMEAEHISPEPDTEERVRRYAVGDTTRWLDFAEGGR